MKGKRKYYRHADFAWTSGIGSKKNLDLCIDYLSLILRPCGFGVKTTRVFARDFYDSIACGVRMRVLFGPLWSSCVIILFLWCLNFL